MKKAIRILTLVLVLCLLAGCGNANSTKSYTCGDLTMTVPFIMRDVSDDSDYASFTFALDSSKVAIFGLNETFADYPMLEDYDTLGYAELLIEGYSLDSVPEQRAEKGYHYVIYTGETEMGEFTYIAGIFRNDSGFWMIQLCAPTTQFDKEAFLGYLDTVTLA